MSERSELELTGNIREKISMRDACDFVTADGLAVNALSARLDAACSQSARAALRGTLPSPTGQFALTPGCHFRSICWIALSRHFSRRAHAGSQRS
jgi:hypothetical protein